MSLSEISENIGVSRNAIHKSIKLIEKKLTFYEDCLGLYKKSLKIKDIIDSVNDNSIKSKLEELLWVMMIKSLLLLKIMICL